VQIPEGEPSLLETYFGQGDPWDNEIMLARWFGTYSLGALQSQITKGERTSEYDLLVSLALMALRELQLH
jgi:hypothetical protein